MAVMMENRFDLDSLGPHFQKEGHSVEVAGKIIALFRQVVAEVTNQIQIAELDIPGKDAVCATCEPERKKECDALSIPARNSSDRLAVHKYKLIVGEVYSVQELIRMHALTVRF